MWRRLNPVPPAPRLGAASRWGVEPAVFAVITAAAVVATWPLARYAGSRVPWNLIDSLENVWIFGWTAHALAHQPLRLFDANMFHPEHTTLAFAENMLGIGIVAAPVCWLSGNPILAANLAALLVYAVGGYGVYLLVHEIGGLRAPALLAGVAFTITPYRALNVVHLHVIGTHLTPYVLALLVALRSSRPTRRRVVGVGLLVALQFWSSLTASLLTVVAAAVVVVWELARRRRASFPFLRAAGAGLAPAILLGGLVLLPYLQVKRDHPEFQQPASAVLTYSATPWSYLAPAPAGRLVRRPWAWLRSHFHENRGEAWETLLFPGLWLLGAGTAGIVAAAFAALRQRQPLPRWAEAVGLFGALGGVAFVLSLGPHLGARPDGLPLPFVLLTRVVPGNLMRVPARIGVLVLLALAVVAGVAIAALPVRLRRLAVLGSVSLLAVEAVGRWTPMVAAPPITAANRAVARASGAVLQLPTVAIHPDGTFARETLLREPVQLYLSTAHYRPITNGYAAFLPTSAKTLLTRIQDLPSASSLRALREQDVGTVVVQTDLVVGTPWANTAPQLDAWPGVRLVAASPGVRVYDVTRAQL